MDGIPAELIQQVVELRTALNIMWVLIAAFLVMFMQAGFALVETGLTRAKNVAHTMAMNFFVYCLGILAFWAVGFGIQMGGVGALSTLGGDTSLTGEYTVSLFGKSWGVFGTTGYFLSAQDLTPAVAALFLFQLVFMDTACTIPTGALAERWKFTSFVLFSLLVAGLIYPLYANWVWGGGWLSSLGVQLGLGHGHVDFAGSSVVHMTGGVLAAVCAYQLGPRIDKYTKEGKARAIPAHHLPMVVTGTFILAFGWFGFNAGSTLAASDTRIAVVAVNTMLASAAGATAAYVHTKVRFGKPDLTMMCNGMLAGLVAITAACAFVGPDSALFIGAVAGTLVVSSALFVENKLGLDDPVGAISVHGVNGMWGILALGLFADGSYGHGLNGVAGGVRGLMGGDGGQLLASAIGILTNVVFVGSVGGTAFWLLNKTVGNRVPAADEEVGLDVCELGMEGYAAGPPELESSTAGLSDQAAF